MYNLKRQIAHITPISQTIFETQIRRSPSLSSEEDEEVSESSSEDSEQSKSSEGHSDEEVNEPEIGARYGAVRIGDDLCLKSGKILSHRSRARQSRHHHYHHQQHFQPRHLSHPSSPSSTSPPLSSETINLILSHRPSHPSQGTRLEPPSHNLILRKGTETSLLGVPEKQQRALVAVAKKMEASGERKMNEFQGGAERKGNCQKTFRVKSIGKKAGGLEKRLG